MYAANQNREAINVFVDVSFLEALVTVLLSFVFSFTFLNAPKVIIIVLQFMFLGINTFWALLRELILTPA